MTEPVKQLVAELIAADPSLQGREAVLTELVADLLAAKPDVSMDAGFRARLRAQLAAQVPQPRARLAFFRGMRVYYGLGVAAVILLLVLVLPDDAPQQVALKSAPEAPPAAELAMDAATGAREAPMAFTQMDAFSLTSSVFPDGGAIPAEFTCDGANAAPPLAWSGVPEGTQSLVLILHDPDAPREGGFTHWVVYDIPPDAAGPQGTDGSNGAGKLGYIGPCPPSGENHRYVFVLSALDIRLGLPPGASKAEVETATQGHVLSTAVLMGFYERP